MVSHAFALPATPGVATMAMFAVFAMIASFWENRLYICVFGGKVCSLSTPPSTASYLLFAFNHVNIQ
jgi:hypothetical protein